MSRTLSIRNRQRIRRVNTALLRRITLYVLREHLHVSDFELAIHLVAEPEMARVNKTFLNHEGSTDVITFDHFASGSRGLHGEIFICLDDAVKQAREFRCAWQNELVRYAIHGLLHLCGHDDLKPTARRKMKLEENRILRAAANEFSIAHVAQVHKPAIGNRPSAI